MIDRIKSLKEMIAYNKRKGASNHMLARLRRELDVAEQELETYMDEALKDWNQVYKSDQRRGKGQSSENTESWYVLKAIMNDNRTLKTKWTQEEKEAYYQALKEFEEEHGKLPRLSRRI